MPLVINSLGADTHTHANTHSHTHTDDPHRINFKKPGARRPAARPRSLKIVAIVGNLNSKILFHYYKYIIFI